MGRGDAGAGEAFTGALAPTPAFAPANLPAPAPEPANSPAPAPAPTLAGRRAR